MNPKLNKNEILAEYYQLYFENTSKARSILKKLDYRNDAFVLSEIATSYFDEITKESL